MKLPDILSEHRQLLDWVPFMSAFLGTRQADRANAAHIIEQLIIALVAAAGALWINDARQDEKIDALRLAVQELKTDMRELRFEHTQPLPPPQKEH